MKAMVLREFNQPLKLEEVEIPRIGADELLIRVRACGVCASNVKYMKGDYGYITPPHILGHEPAGEVADVGADVKGFAIKDRVCVYIFIACRECLYCNLGQENNCLRSRRIGMELPGAYAEYVKAPARNVFKIPDHISYEEAAVIPDAVNSPFHALKEKAKVKMGEDIAIIGIGGLGIHAVQIAKLAGAKVIAIVNSSRKLELAREHGADELIDVRKEHIVERIRSITDGKGVDSFVDLVGSPESVHAGLHGLRKGGRLVLIGHDPHHDFRAQTFKEIIMEEIEITGSHASTRRNMEEVLHLVQERRLKPVVAAQYPLKEVNEAHRVLQSEEILGRIVLVI